jgi:hypothetical protein
MHAFLILEIKKKMNFMNPTFITQGFAWIPYVLLSWGYAQVMDDNFLKVLGVLIAARLFFSTIETIGSIFSWRLYGKKKIVQLNLNILEFNNFPKRDFEHDDFLNYLARIEINDDFSVQLKVVAKNWEQSLAFFEHTGILIGMRMHAAAADALDIYSPKKIG